MKIINIYCFPFAGGGKYSYREFTAKAPDMLNFITLESPGRGARSGEPILYELEAIVEDAYNQLMLDELYWTRPYAFYGHSMGAIVGFLVAQKIAQSPSLPKPLRLFLTGRSGPSANAERHYHSLPENLFIQKLQELGGMPEEILRNRDLMHFFEPVLRADFKALETFKYCQSEPLDIPIDVVIGLGENISQDQARAWVKESTAQVEIKRMPGNHFFIFDHALTLMRLMSYKLTGEILMY